MILLLSAAAAYHLVPRLYAQLLYLSVLDNRVKGNDDLVAQSLEKIADYMPRDHMIRRKLGDAVSTLAEQNPNVEGAYESAETAWHHYQEALRLNPASALSALRLALQEDWLEILYTGLNSADNANPYNALPYYELAIRLRPHGIDNHYALARYYYRHAKPDDMLQVVQTLTRIYPPIYTYLKEETFWSPLVQTACRQGLQAAVRDNILAATAHSNLSAIAEEKEEWTLAIDHLRQALQLRPHDISENSYFRLGRLSLKLGDTAAARTNFLDGFALSRSRHEHMESLYRTFKSEDRLDEFIDFYPEVQQRFSLSDQTDLFLARALIDLKRYGRARQIIEELNEDEPTAEAYYWLAKIAEHKEDWDQMELAIQKATVLEPENNHYRQVFFGLLRRLKKLESAERQLDLMIEYADNPSAGLYNQKAWLRWNQKDYAAALEAWQKAIALKSDTAAYHAQAAEAYVMLGNWSEAVAYYQKAVDLDPQNERFQKRYHEIAGDDAGS